MTLLALTQLLRDDVAETVEALAAPLRSVSPHMAEMVHAQLLSDCTLFCESLWAIMPGSAQADQGRQLFAEYLDRRRKVGFSEAELYKLVTATRPLLKKLLEVYCSRNDLDEAARHLESGLIIFEQIIALTDSTANR